MCCFLSPTFSCLSLPTKWLFWGIFLLKLGQFNFCQQAWLFMVLVHPKQSPQAFRGLRNLVSLVSFLQCIIEQPNTAGASGQRFMHMFVCTYDPRGLVGHRGIPKINDPAMQGTRSASYPMGSYSSSVTFSVSS